MCSRTMWSVDGHPILIGRNMDWTESLRTKLYVMPRGIEMDGLVQENPLKWTSKFGSVVASAYDCSTMDGMNEAGLCVNCNYLAEATYGERDPFEANDRFVRGAYYLTQLPDNPPSYQAAVAGLLSVMRNQATPMGANDPVRPNVSATLWITVSDVTNLRYYFTFTDMPNVLWIDLKNLNLEDGAPIQMFDLKSDIEASGEVSGQFASSEQIAYQMAGTAVG